MTAGKADASYKFGAGRYIQCRELLEHAGEEIARYGKKPYIVGGPTAVSVVKPRLKRGLEAAAMDSLFDVHPGHVYHEAAKQRAELARANGCDVVVGVGGGRMMDFAKLCAYYLGAPVVNMPTSISTCAAYSPFSLIYTPEGRTIPGNFCYDLEVASVLVDLDIMAGQPARYVVSGMLDAMGKFPEIKNGRPVLEPEGSSVNLYAGYLLSRYTFDKLGSLMDQVLADVGRGAVTQALEEAVFLNIPLTGIISALSRGVGQSAIAHELYYQARFLFTQDAMGALHGEIVGVGMIMQFYYNGTPELIDPFVRRLKGAGAPTCLSEIGIAPTADNCRMLREAIAATPHVVKDKASGEKFAEAFGLIAH